MAVHEAKGCFVWAALRLAGGVNPSHPTGTLQQRHLYKPLLRIKPVVTFFFSAGFSTRDNKAGGPGQSHGAELFTLQLAPPAATAMLANTDTEKRNFRIPIRAQRFARRPQHPRCHQTFKSDLCVARCRAAAVSLCLGSPPADISC